MSLNGRRLANMWIDTWPCAPLKRAGHAIILLILGLPIAAQAAESPSPITPPGGTDLYQAVLPPESGLYGVVIAMPIGRNFHSYDAQGNQAPASMNAVYDSPTFAGALMYVYPFGVLGGRLMSSAAISAQHYSFKVGDGSHVDQSEGAWGNIYSDIFYWTRNVGLLGAEKGVVPLPYGLNVGAGFAMTIPTGTYDEAQALRGLPQPVEPVFSFVPNFAMTYITATNWLTPASSLQLSARAFFGFPTENKTTNYQNGDTYDVDFSVGERIGPVVAGLAGYYQAQYNDDVVNGITKSDSRYSYWGLGPVLEYDIPQYNMSMKAKFQQQFDVKNSLDMQILSFSVAIKF
ncbi:SphA family protein [Segnochrobactrum spirostomi]|nr:transporter [Segnochrobactrum spirostomi]